MTGSSTVKIRRETEDGYWVVYEVCLPWTVRRIDYEAKPSVDHAGLFFTLNNLLWCEDLSCPLPCRLTLMPLNSMIPRKDWLLGDHSELVLEEDADRILGLPRESDEETKIFNLSCCRQASTIHPSMAKDLWIPQAFRGSIIFD